MPDANTKRNILIQLDPDPQPSSFDRVVAIDAGVDQVFAYGGVSPDQVEALVHGAIFTRGMNHLASTAIFIGGSDVELGARVLAAARKTFLGPLQVSLMLDSSGANTTAAGAVFAAVKQLGSDGRLDEIKALVLGATGPVGRRVSRLLAHIGAQVRIGSRSLERSTSVMEAVREEVSGAELQAVATASEGELQEALAGAELVIAAGGAGVCLLPASARQQCSHLRVAIDLNAVPPEGIEGIKVTDTAKDRGGQIAYGAIGVGGIKMKIHKAAVSSLFDSNDQVLDVEQIFEIGRKLDL